MNQVIGTCCTSLRGFGVRTLDVVMCKHMFMNFDVRVQLVARAILTVLALGCVTGFFGVFVTCVSVPLLQTGGLGVYTISALCTLNRDKSEREILLELYESCNGANWSVRTNWCSDKPLAQWHGVTTNKGQVIGLNLNSNNLEGEIPKELGSLAELKELNLSNNKLAGEIPKELGELTESENKAWLDFHERITSDVKQNNMLLNPVEEQVFNRMREGCLSEDKLPVELQNLKKLERLILSYNKLTVTELPEGLSIRSCYFKMYLDHSANQ
jgi:hypothetical protein